MVGLWNRENIYICMYEIFILKQNILIIIGKNSIGVRLTTNLEIFILK